MSGAKRIVICGGGAIGVAIAYFLSRRGARPIVIERHAVAGAASGKPVPDGARQGSEGKWFLPERRALLVRSAASARNPRQPVGSCMCVHKRLMKPCKGGDKNKKLQHFDKRIRHEQASRRRFHKRYEGWAYDARAMMACTKRWCSMW